MQLYYTLGSHFARKVRLLLAGLQIEVELVNAINTARSETTLFGPHPLLTVPCLVDGDHEIFDSDPIAAWLVRRFDALDRFQVLTTDTDRLNARAVLNGVMTAEVELLLAARSGLPAVNARWDKKRQVIRQGLAWLETHAALFVGKPDYLDLHLLACWDHLQVFGHFPALPLPVLAERVAMLHTLPFVTASAHHP